MISERTDKCIHKPKGTQELQFDEYSHLGHMCTKEVGYMYCAPKYVFMNFLLRAYHIKKMSIPRVWTG
jgi:hypothetical protein